MEKMINVINDNLISVINGIKEHYNDLEETLKKVSNEIDDKVKQACKTKDDILNSKTIIETLENEISSLENDLNELNDRFKAKDFKEIIAAGNREINAKIIEKRSIINEQGHNILILTDSARNIKELLSDLKEKKSVIEENLLKTKALENYYTEKINEIVSYSQEHIDELTTYYDDVVLENDDINTIIDDSIFDEIATIKESEPDEELLEKVLKNPDEITVESTDETKPQDEIITNELEDMIEVATKIIEEHENFKDYKGQENVEENTVTVEDNSIKNIFEDDEYLDINIDEPKNIPIEEETTEKIEEKNKEDFTDTELINNLIIETEKALQNPYTDEKSSMMYEEDETVQPTAEIEKSLDDFIINQDIFNTPSSESISDADLNSVNEEVDNQEINNIDSIFTDNNPDEIKLDENKENDNNASELNTENTPNNLEIDLNNDDIKNVFSLSPSDNQEIDLGINLDPVILSKLTDNNVNMNELKSKIDILKSKEITEDNIIDNIENISSISQENLEKIFELISKTNAKVSDINLLFKYILKLNIEEFAKNVELGNNEFTSVLVSSIKEKSSFSVNDELNLDNKVISEFLKNASSEEKEIFEKIPEVIINNYKELEKYNVENINECFKEHPHRFTITPSEFFSILDKYDPEDLVRCIVKNSAVIDKL